MGRSPSDGGDLARFLLYRIMENRNRVENFKCNVEYRTYISKEVMQRMLDNLFKKANGPLDQKAIQRSAARFNEHTFQKHRLAFDKEGRARVEMVTGILDNDGNPMEGDMRRIATWDGESAIRYTEESERKAALLGDTQPSTTKKDHRQPWQTFGGIVCDRFAQAIADGTVINVKRRKDETYQIEFIFYDSMKNISVIDPTQGYSVTTEENYENGQLIYRATAKFEEVSSNAWFPVEGETVSFGGPDLSQVVSRDRVRVTEIIINDPNFYDDLFHVDFPEGTVVRDAVSGYQYVVGEPMSEKADGASKSLHEVAIDTLEEIAEEINQKHTEFEMLIPKVDIAIENKEPFVLSISDNNLINPQNKPESRETDKFLAELGKGDIAWDGTLIATRGAVVLTTKQESKRPLKVTKGKWTNSYELPEKVELPYSMLVVTRERVNFLMTILKIESRGITVAYRELSPNELSPYKQ
jgi:hypothetical protein